MFLGLNLEKPKENQCFCTFLRFALLTAFGVSNLRQFGHPGGLLGHQFGHLRRHLGHLGRQLGRLGRQLGRLGRQLGHLGCRQLGDFGPILERFWVDLGAILDSIFVDFGFDSASLRCCVASFVRWFVASELRCFLGS